MPEAQLNYFQFNNKIYNTAEFDNLYKDFFPSVYEVIRIIDRVPLFLEDHYTRFMNSLKLASGSSNYDIKYVDIEKSINNLIKLNNISNCNIKIVVNNIGHDKNNEYYFFIKSIYPDKSLYDEGIKTFTYNAVRNNPNAKIINHDLRDTVNRLLNEKNCYEALLVNDNDEITEGSRSNMFFLKDKTVYTSPVGDVLPGITRQKIIKLLRKNEIEFKEEPILENEIENFDSAFMSGTSPKVLPISYINDIKFSIKNELLQKIMKIYDDEITSYIKSHKKQK
jgi:branched-chain amino acid aminotransferase